MLGQGPISMPADLIGLVTLDKPISILSSAFHLVTSGADWIGCWGSSGTPFSLYRHLCHSLLLGITQNPQKFTSENMLPDTHSKQDTVPVTNPMYA